VKKLRVERSMINERLSLGIRESEKFRVKRRRMKDCLQNKGR